MNLSKITTLTEDEIKLFKDDPETFREYLKFKTRQMEIANDIDTKNHEERMKAIDIDHEERMKAFDADHEERMKALDTNLEENDRKRKAEAEADERKYEAEAEADKRKYEAEAEARKAEMQKIIEANDRRERIWATAICGVGALCEFLDQKDSKKKNESKTKISNDQIVDDNSSKQIEDAIMVDPSSQTTEEKHDYELKKRDNFYDPQKEAAMADSKF